MFRAHKASTIRSQYFTLRMEFFIGFIMNELTIKETQMLYQPES